MKKQTLLRLIKEEIRRSLSEQPAAAGAPQTPTGITERKKYKFNKKVQIMQKMLAGHPEIGEQLKALMSRNGRLKVWADGKLGPSTQRSVNILRKHYRGKTKIPRGVSNVIDFLASPKGGGNKNRAAKQQALGLRAGAMGHKIRSRVDRLAKMAPQQQSKLLKTLSPTMLRQFKGVADEKGYKTISLVADTILASQPDVPERVSAKAAPREKRMDKGELTKLKATWDAACKRRGMVAVDTDPGRGRFTCERAVGAGEADIRRASVKAGGG